VGDVGFDPEVHALLKRASTDRVLVACSGGADSVYMLALLTTWADELGLQLVVAHYNHRWRDEASDGDAAFVESMADGLSLEFISDVRPDNEAAFTETTARALRLDFLRQTAAQHKCRWIAFGHQMDDILETQLQRIARGCGSDGLAAPRPIAKFSHQPTHIRPLLNLRAGDIRMALDTCEIPWCEDSSNDDLDIARNALRRSVIPGLIEALDRDPSIGAARSRRLLEEDAVALDELARQSLPSAFTGQVALDRRELRSIPRALVRRALMAWLHGHNLIQSVSAPSMDALLDAVLGPKKKHRISAGVGYIVFDAEVVRIELLDGLEVALLLEPALLEPGDSVILSTGAVMELEVVEIDAAKQRSILAGEIDQANEAFIEMKKSSSFEVRGWRPGDRFSPIGAPGSKKLKDWFIDRRIPQRERKQLPIVTNNSGTIVWVPGFPPADACKIHRSTKRALRLTYQTRNPL
jgi:tRNA(Ile)-lysidine synthase